MRMDHPIWVSVDRCGRAGVSECGDADLAGHLTGFMAAHAAGNDKEPMAGVSVVFALLPHTPGWAATPQARPLVVRIAGCAG